MQKIDEKELIIVEGDALKLHNIELECKLLKKEIEEKDFEIKNLQKEFNGILDKYLGAGKRFTGINFKKGILKYIVESKTKNQG